MTSEPFPLTPQQRQAVTTTGRSLLVSAAAGSGKTAVLAERCAYLVCDAPDDVRCDVDALLVVTFTESAAAEMRSRIVQAMRRRVAERPDDARLRRQLALVDAARICTLHAFCLWLIRRWFNELDLDPGAAVMDEEEASLLRKEVLAELIAGWLATRATPDDPLGRARVAENAESEVDLGVWRLGERPTATLGPALIKLIDDYGLGNDREIGAFLLRLHSFVYSIPDPQSWLGESVERLSRRPEVVVGEAARTLGVELSRQIEWCVRLADRLALNPPGGEAYVEAVRNHVQQLRDWHRQLAPEDKLKGAIDLERFESVRAQIDAFDFGRVSSGPRGKNVDETAKAWRDIAADVYNKTIKERLFRRRLRNRLARFSTAEITADLRRTAPYVATISDAVVAFDDAFARTKRRLNVLDFADQERFALRLLRPDPATGEPSAASRFLHQRFTHVLVDEYQDINPLQQTILHHVSRESDPAQPGNLFAVGDVKQSIYRFRLAEPTLFTDRLDRFRAERGGSVVYLPNNFRSRVEILDAVNLVFRQLMREGMGETVYDAQAELRPGRPDDPSCRRTVELHLLEQRADLSDDADDEGTEDGDGGPAETKAKLEPRPTDPTDSSHWSAIEREAYCIGTMIREWMREGRGAANGEPLRYRDMAVLLRAKKINAERVATMLTARGIPTYADAGGSLLASLEVRDVTAALQVMDNLQQDIPLAAVMRSGILGESFTEDELATIRCLDRSVPFHAAVRAFAEQRKETDLKGRVEFLLDRIRSYRDQARRRPLADILRRLYEDEGYLARAAGLPNPMQRQANLFKLQELARRFGTFRRQGLHRFLQFLQSLTDEELDLALAPSLGEAEDVVRILSIHQAKGLEFPVVFLAGLGTRFNPRDTRGRMLFERKSLVGLRVVHPAKMIEYPSLAHRLVVDEIERNLREEEMRVLYVAMTRAKERLVLVGSAQNIEGRLDDSARGGKAGISTLEIALASTPLDWLLPALRNAPDGAVDWTSSKNAASEPPKALFSVQVHGAGEVARWRLQERSDQRTQEARRSVARCEPLPAGEPTAPDHEEVEQVLSRLEFHYPYAELTALRATIAASETEGGDESSVEPQPRFASTPNADAFSVPPSKYDLRTAATPIHRGIVTHRVLQYLDFHQAVGDQGVESELQRLFDAGIMAPEERELVDAAALQWFVHTPLGQRIRAAGSAFRRELRYIAAEPLAAVGGDPQAGAGDYRLVRGILDGVLVEQDALEVVDYKTDAIGADGIQQRSDFYRPQVTLYAKAVARMWRRPVRNCWLVFLTPRQVIEITPRE